MQHMPIKDTNPTTIGFLDLPEDIQHRILHELNSEGSIGSEKSLTRLEATSKSMRQTMDSAGIFGFHRDRANIFANSSLGDTITPLSILNQNPRLRSAWQLQAKRLTKQFQSTPTEPRSQRQLQDAMVKATLTGTIHETDLANSQGAYQARQYIDVAYTSNDTPFPDGMNTTSGMQETLKDILYLEAVARSEGKPDLIDRAQKAIDKAKPFIQESNQFTALLDVLETKRAPETLLTAIEDRFQFMIDHHHDALPRIIQERLQECHNTRIQNAAIAKLCRLIESGTLDHDLQQGKYSLQDSNPIRSAVRNRLISMIELADSYVLRTSNLQNQIQLFMQVEDQPLLEAVRSFILSSISTTGIQYRSNEPRNLFTNALVTENFKSAFFEKLADVRPWAIASMHSMGASQLHSSATVLQNLLEEYVGTTIVNSETPLTHLSKFGLYTQSV